MSQQINGRIINYRIGTKAIAAHECLIQVSGMADISKAGKLVGKKVVWVNGKNPHAGRIIGVHGRNGVVKAKFAKGVPGQAIGGTVTIVA